MYNLQYLIGNNYQEKNDDDVGLYSLKIPSLITNNGIQFLSESKEGKTGLLLIYNITNDHHHSLIIITHDVWTSISGQ